MSLTSLKKSIISIVQSNLGSEIGKNALAVATTTGVVATGTNPILAIPVLLGAYFLYSYGKDRLDNDQKQQELNELFNKIKKEFYPKLDTIRSTEISLLEKELNNSIKADKIIELQNFVISIFEKQSSSISAIANKLSFTKNEITELVDCADTICQKLTVLQESNTSEHKQILGRIDELKEMINDQSNSISEPQNQHYTIVQSVISAGTIDIVIKTGINEAFDISIQAVWKEIVACNYIKALQQLELLLSEPEYYDSVLAKIWTLTLQAKINYITGKGQEANKLISDAKALLKLSKIKKLDPVLQVIHARYHIYKNEKSEALEILKKLISQGGEISLEARALWICLVDKTAKELEAILSNEQRNNFLIAEALANKFSKEKNYDKYLYYAQISFDRAKQVNALPCYSLLATALTVNKIRSETSTFGLTRNNIDKSSWPEFHQIVSLYNNAINHYASLNNGCLLSQLYYNLAGVYFMCGEAADADYYIDKVFALSEIAQGIIQGCVTIWIKLDKHVKALNALAKIQEGTSSEIRFLYAKLLLDTDRKTINKNACDIFFEIIKSYKTDTNIRLYSSLHLAWACIEDNNIDTFNNLHQHLVTEPQNSLTVKLVEALKLEKENEAEAIVLLRETIPTVPKKILRNGDFLDIIMPLLRRLKMGNVILDILAPIVPTDEITDIGIEYFRYALSEKDNNRVKTFCQQLRDASCYDFGILCDEIFYVALRSNQEAAQLSQEILNYDLSPLLRKQINVCYDMIRARLGTLKDANVSTESYPSLDEIDNLKPPFPWCNIPLLMKEKGYIIEAIDYAYELLLRFPQDKYVPRIYLGTILLNKNSEEAIVDKKHNVASVNSVVTFENKQRCIKNTVIIDDSDFSNEIRKEYKSDSSMGKLLIGRKVGDNIELSSFGNVNVTITAIESKYTYAIGKIMDRETQSPDSVMTQFHVELDSDGNPDFSEMAKITRKQQEEQQRDIDKMKQLFLNSLQSFYIFAHCSHLGIQKSLRYFASQSDLFIPCCTGDTNEYIYILNLLREKNKKILLSPMTVEILLLIEATSDINVVELLRSSGLKFCVCEYIPDDYRQELQFPFSGDIICENNGVLSATTDELAIKRHKALFSMMEFFNEIEVIAGELHENEFQPSLNNSKWLWGRSFYQTLLIASSDDNIIVWDDDAISLAACMNDYDEIKIKSRIFTQSFFRFLAEQEILSPEDNVQVNVLLLAINERFTSFDALTVVEVLSNIEKYSTVKEKLLAYLEIGFLDKQSVYIVSQIAATLFVSNYTDRQKAKQGFKIWFDKLKEYDKQLAKTAINNGAREAYKQSKKKAKPFLKFIANNYVGILDYSDVIDLKKLADIPANSKKNKRKKKNKR